jgi:hypothetical protein
VLRRIFAPKKEDTTVRPIKLHDEELHYFHPSPDLIRISNQSRIMCVGYIACMGKMRNA